MASPVDTSVKHYRSDMPGAPVVNGVAGSRVAQLEACLCTGYGLKSSTSLVVASGVATLSFSGGASAAWKDAVILVAGVTGSMTDLNGEQKVTFADSSTVKFATALADGTAAGTVTFKVAPAGWEKVYSKTNVAVFRSLDAASSKMLLRVDDTATTLARVVGYEAMTDVDTGFGAFPTPAQQSGGGYWSKSDTANSTPVAWVLASDGLFFIDSVAPGAWRGLTYQAGYTRGFGDPIAKNPAGDAYACVLNFSNSSSAGGSIDGLLDGSNEARSAFARGYAGLGSCVLGKRAPYLGSVANGAAAFSGRDLTCGAFPSVVDGSLVLSGIYFSEAANAPIRADVPGIFYSPQTLVGGAFALFDTVDSGARTLICVRGGESSSSGTVSTTSGCSFIDTTGPWR